ncbi:hypothetical protein SNEBB_008168 [Seison nebaliae]|nr:hypothetical protein SNEBB_008168 [Seison nebaliae]
MTSVPRARTPFSSRRRQDNLLGNKDTKHFSDFTPAKLPSGQSTKYEKEIKFDLPNLKEENTDQDKTLESEVHFPNTIEYSEYNRVTRPRKIVRNSDSLIHMLLINERPISTIINPDQAPLSPSVFLPRQSSDDEYE